MKNLKYHFLVVNFLFFIDVYSMVDSSLLLNLLVSSGLIEQFGQNIYLKTDNLKLRNINDQPDFLWYCNPCGDRCINFKVSGFYNKTNHVFFSDCSSKLSSYVNFNNIELANAVAQAIPIGGQTPAVIFAALKDTNLSAEKAGAMVQAKFDHPRVSFQLQMPFYQIKLTPLLTRAGKKLSNSFANGPIFGSKHFSVGDIKGKLSFPFITNNCLVADIGLIFSLPTHKYKSREMCVPDIDLNRILTLAVTPTSLGGNYLEAFDNLNSFLLTGKNYLNNMILEAGQFGNYGHFTVGAMGHLAYQPCDYFSFIGYAEAQYFLPRDERRFFLKNKNKSDFIPSRFASGLSNNDIANQDLEFLSQTFKDMIFPTAKCVRINPKCTFELTLEPHFYFCGWDLLLGYDFWYRQTESTPFCSDLKCFDVCNAVTRRALQHKIIAGLSYLFCGQCADFEFSLRADGAIKTRNIGKDYTAVASLSVSY